MSKAGFVERLRIWISRQAQPPLERPRCLACPSPACSGEQCTFLEDAAWADWICPFCGRSGYHRHRYWRFGKLPSVK